MVLRCAQDVARKGMCAGWLHVPGETPVGVLQNVAEAEEVRLAARAVCGARMPGCRFFAAVADLSAQGPAAYRFPKANVFLDGSVQGVQGIFAWLPQGAPARLSSALYGRAPGACGPCSLWRARRAQAISACRERAKPLQLSIHAGKPDISGCTVRPPGAEAGMRDQFCGHARSAWRCAERLCVRGECASSTSPHAGGLNGKPAPGGKQ